MTHAAGARGFTVLELLVTLAIVAIMGAAALVGWWHVEAALALDRGVHQIAADVESTRVLAVAAATSVRLVFTAGTGRYRRERLGDGGAYVLERALQLPRDVTVADVNSGGDFVFSGRGNGENGTVTLVDRRGVVRRLRLNQRGRVTVLGAGAT
jgi:prepilin-type N-terminal cleavage/methylation domain-containing protein